MKTTFSFNRDITIYLSAILYLLLTGVVRAQNAPPLRVPPLPPQPEQV